MRLIVGLTLAAFVSIVGVGLAQDPVKTEKDHYHLVAESAMVRVLHVIYTPGSKSGTHSHPDAAIIALDAAKVRFGLPDGKTQDSDHAKDSAMFTPAGTHSVTNLGGKFEGILVEFKTPGPGKAVIPASRPDMTLKVLAEGPRASVIRSTADGKFFEPAGTKHDFDQVVIALGPAQMSVSLDGKPAKTTWARGDSLIIPRGTAHESKNLGGKPVDMIIVAVK